MFVVTHVILIDALMCAQVIISNASSVMDCWRGCLNMDYKEEDMPISWPVYACMGIGMTVGDEHSCVHYARQSRDSDQYEYDQPGAVVIMRSL